MAVIIQALTACTLTIIILYFGSTLDNWTSLSAYIPVLNTISFNLGAPPWLDLKTQNSSICPPNYNLVSRAVWPGSIPGCLQGLMLTKGICSNTTNPGVNTTTIPGFASVELDYWKQRAFCALPATDFYAGTSCSAGYIQCSYGWCYNSMYGCPITNITVQRGLYPSDVNTTALFLNGNDTMYINRYWGLPPIVNIKYSVDNLPCLDYTRAPKAGLNYNLLQTSPGVNYNEVDTTLNDGCGRFASDPRSTFTDWQNDHDFLGPNFYRANVPVFQTLPGYQEVAEQRFVFLVSQSKYVTMNSAACFSLTNGSLTFYTEELDAFNHSMYAASIVFAVFYVGMAPCFVWIFFATFLSKEKTKIISRFFDGTAGMTCIQVVPTVVIFVVSFKSKRDAAPGISYLLSLSGMNCFMDDVFNNAIDSLANICNLLMTIYSMITTIFVMSMVLVGVTILMKFYLDQKPGFQYEIPTQRVSAS